MHSCFALIHLQHEECMRYICRTDYLFKSFYHHFQKLFENTNRSFAIVVAITKKTFKSVLCQISVSQTVVMLSCYHVSLSSSFDFVCFRFNFSRVFKSVSIELIHLYKVMYGIGENF